MTTITIDRAIVEQALEVLVRASSHYDTCAEIDALRAALAEPVQSGSCISCGNRMTGSPESFVVATAEVGVIAPDGYSKHQVEALCSHKGGDVLSTPLSEPEQEPVAWMWEETAPRSSTGIGGIDRKLLFCRPADEPWKRNITPLYTAPPQRKPLTEEEIDAEWHELDGEAGPMFRRVLRNFARAIERAHGIGDA